MSDPVDNSIILYEFAIDLGNRGYEVAVLEEWISRYPSASEQLMDFFIDEVRTEEMAPEDHHTIPRPTLDAIKNTGISQLRLLLTERGNGASKRA
jgi:hypothetical protein